MGPEVADCFAFSLTSRTGLASPEAIIGFSRSRPTCHTRAHRSLANISQVPECPEQEPPRKDEASQASRRDGGLPARLPICKAAESIQFIEEAPERPRRVGVK